MHTANRAPQIRPSLWFDGNAEEAAAFYVGLFPDSRIDRVMHSPEGNTSTGKGEVVLVEFTLAGSSFTGINGGPQFSFTEAVSFEIRCRDQAEVDRYRDALIADGGSPSRCGWCRDRFGLSWQVVPVRLHEMLNDADRDAAGRAMKAMLQMDRLDLAALEAAFAG